VRVITGSDFPVEPLAPLSGLQRLAASGNGAIRLPVDTALALMTDPSAGTVVLSDDPHHVAEDELAQIEVEDTHPA
jgi:predicted amidohydrolase YtcJ